MPDTADPNQAAFQQNQRDAQLRAILTQPLSDASATTQPLLNPAPLAHTIGQNISALDPMPAIRALLRGVRDIGVGGANAGLDMMGVPKSDFQSPIQNWIDRQLAEPGHEPPPPPDPQAQQQNALRGLAIDHANAMKEITNQSLPPAHYDSLVQSIQTDPHGFLRSLGINRGAQ